MSEENVEVARRFVDALNAFLRGEVSSEAWLVFWDEEGEFYPLRPSWRASRTRAMTG
jgi:hypothetical protein